jgi:hypothetical protein
MVNVIKTMPVSMGKNSTPTNNGTYIVGDRFSHIVMDSSTYGVPVNSPNGYRTEVDWATQISYSGIFVHAAPWSVGSQGYSNVSHGCINVSTSNASGSTTTPSAATSSRSSTRWVRSCPDRWARRLEHPVGAVESGQRQHLTAAQCDCGTALATVVARGCRAAFVSFCY